MDFKAVLLDIEGTTTPIDFVHKTLFPFARERVGAFVAEHFADLHREIEQLRVEHQQDVARGEAPPAFDERSPASLAEYLKFLIDSDRKSTPLKAIQGKIWQAGYESGALEGAVYEDVLPAFERLRTAGKTIAIFSSGSVLAQKLIFGFSTAGDLTKHISAYFDTTTGAKKEAESYRKIAESLSFPPVEILFVSDIQAELDAASAAGMQTRLAVRQNSALPEAPVAHPIIESFEELE
jgi:enolase-phosphatase E1